eukprot:2753888-Rhodomonas_salina.2
MASAWAESRVYLGVVRTHSLAELRVALAKRLSQMHHREIREVRHSCDRLQNVEAREVSLAAGHWVEEANDVINRINDDLIEAVNPFFHLPGCHGSIGSGRNHSLRTHSLRTCRDSPMERRSSDLLLRTEAQRMLCQRARAESRGYLERASASHKRKHCKDSRRHAVTNR